MPARGGDVRKNADTPNKAAVQRLLKAFGHPHAAKGFEAEVEDGLLVLKSKQPMECNSIQPTTYLVGDTGGHPVLTYEDEEDDDISLARKGDDLVITRKIKGGKKIVSRIPFFKKGVKEKAREYALYSGVLIPAKAKDVVADTAADTAYLGAAMSGDVDGMRKALDSGASPTATVNGLSALQLACHKGHLEAVRFLLKKGADAKDGGVQEWPPLPMAACGELLLDKREADRLPMLRLLLDAGADVDASGPDGRTALLALLHDPACMKELLARGANPNAKDEMGNTPLLNIVIQVYEGEEFPVETMKILMKAGADLGVVNKFGQTVFLKVVENKGPVELVRQLLEAGAAKTIDNYSCNERTALTMAAMAGNAELVELLLAHGADPNVQGPEHGWTALNSVNGKEACKIARMLLEHGAKVGLADKRGITPLMKAAYSGNAPLVRLLLDAGANPNHRDKASDTALDLAKGPQIRKLLRERMKK